MFVKSVVNVELSISRYHHYKKTEKMEVKRKIRKRKKNRLRAVSLFSVVRRAKRETRKWPRACLMARDGRGTRPRLARLAASPLPRACIALTKETARSLKKTDRVDLGTIQDPPFLSIPWKPTT